jgi:protocatechuate 3,4-dioxygenase, alpha subunit
MSNTPSAAQTVGPFFGVGFDWLTTSPSMLEAPLIRGILYDGDGIPVPDAVLEIWAPENGERVRFQRVTTDEQGVFAWSIQLAEGRPNTPVHCAVQLFMRGLLKPLLTRVYVISDERDHAGLSDDPVWSMIPTARRQTVLATPMAGRAQHYGWNLYLQDTPQGGQETVFFTCASESA